MVAALYSMLSFLKQAHYMRMLSKLTRSVTLILQVRFCSLIAPQDSGLFDRVEKVICQSLNLVDV